MRVKLLVACLAVCATASSAFAAQPPDTSVTYQVSPTHAGEVPASTLEPPFERAWIRFDLGATSYPVIAQGLVVVAHPTGGSRDGATVTALDAQTGETVWSMPLGGDTYPFGGVAYEDGRVYALNAAGMMRGIDAGTGTLLWERKLPQRSFNSPPTARDGLVYTAGSGSGGTLSAVVGATGAIAWTASVQNGDESSPAVDDSRVYVSYSCHTVYGFDRVTGARLWWHRTGCSGGGGHTPTVFDGRVYTRELNDWDGLVLDAATGGELGPFQSSTLPAFSLGTMVYREEAVLRGDNALGGWAFSGDGRLSSTPIIANGVAYVGSNSGRVYGVDVLDGTLVWQGHAGAPVPWPTNQSVQSKTGLGAGQGVLIVPTTHGVTAFSEIPVVPTPTPTPEPTPTETPTPTPTVKPPLTTGSPMRERGIRILTPRPWHRPVAPRLAALSRPHG